MERELFAQRLHEAAAAARDFARNFIEESLPDDMVFRVRLNCSYDGNPLVGDESVFPDDGTFERADALKLCDAQQVVAALWRDGRVPEWIDVSVLGETGAATLVQLECCGRFTADDGLLYHAAAGRPPFHETSPVLPVRHEAGQKFSIYQRAECWTIDELDRLRAHADKVWSLDLVGSAFDDATLANLPNLPRVELLALRASTIRGAGLSVLTRFPKLRVLRIRLADVASFRIPKPSTALALETFDIDGPLREPWGFADLVDRCPCLRSLTFGSRGALLVDGDCPRATEHLFVRATRIAGGLRLPRTIEDVHAHLSDMTDREVDAWLGSATRIGSLYVGGTPISDAFAESLPRRFGLRSLNLVDAGVSDTALERIRRAHPELKLLPLARSNPR